MHCVWWAWGTITAKWMIDVSWTHICHGTDAVKKLDWRKWKSIFMKNLIVTAPIFRVIQLTNVKSTGKFQTKTSNTINHNISSHSTKDVSATHNTSHRTSNGICFYLYKCLARVKCVRARVCVCACTALTLSWWMAVSRLVTLMKHCTLHCSGLASRSRTRYSPLFLC